MMPAVYDTAAKVSPTMVQPTKRNAARRQAEYDLASMVLTAPVRCTFTAREDWRHSNADRRSRQRITATEERMSFRRRQLGWRDKRPEKLQDRSGKRPAFLGVNDQRNLVRS